MVVYSGGQQLCAVLAEGQRTELRNLSATYQRPTHTQTQTQITTLPSLLVFSQYRAIPRCETEGTYISEGRLSGDGRHLDLRK